MNTIPFAHGSISLGLYVHDLPPGAMTDVLVEQAVLGDAHGFDGVTVAEHHGGYASYLPNPILATEWLLAAMPSAWSGPNPVLLPLRPPAQVVEDLAWLAARHPGRVGASFASGYLESDYVAWDVAFATRHARFRSGLELVGRELSGEGEALRGDPAVRAAADAPGQPPLLVAATGPRAIDLAASLGMGVSVASTAVEPLAAAHRRYRDAGGVGPRHLLRWVWLGEHPSAALRRFDEQYQHDLDGTPRTNTAALMDVTSGDAAGVVEGLAADMVASDSTALSIRIHLPGMPPAAVSEQIAAIGTEVLPRLRSALA